MTRTPQKRYRWEAKPEALAGLTTGFIDVYNQSEIGCPSRGEAGERENGELSVGVMFQDLMVVEPGVYRLVVCAPVYVCMHVCMCVWMDGWMDGWMLHACMYVCLFVSLYVYMYVCMYVCSG